jgi:molybdenum cofactor guanylyltransferase
MGRPKALATLGGVPMIVHVAGRLSAVCDPVVIVAREADLAEDLGLAWTSDRPPFEGPLAGIEAGLRACPDGPVVVVGCDMPFLEPASLRAMVGLLEDHQAVVPRDGRGPHPLHAVYSSSCADDAARLLDTGERRAQALAEAVNTAYVDVELIDPTGRSMRSVDTPEDLAAAEAELS